MFVKTVFLILQSLPIFGKRITDVGGILGVFPVICIFFGSSLVKVLLNHPPYLWATFKIAILNGVNGLLLCDEIFDDMSLMEL